MTTTDWVEAGTTGKCAMASTVGAGFGRIREFPAPGVPRLPGIGKRNTRPKLRSHVCPIITGIPETQRPSKLRVRISLEAMVTTSTWARFALVSPVPWLMRCSPGSVLTVAS